MRRFPPWWGLVGVGRRFDGEAGNVCIEGDASAHTPDACAAPVAIVRKFLCRLFVNTTERWIS